jgi:hypothetical protein
MAPGGVLPPAGGLGQNPVEVPTVRNRTGTRCVQRTPRRQDSLATWAKAVVADPAAYCATEREAAIIGELAAKLPGGAR